MLGKSTFWLVVLLGLLVVAPPARAQGRTNDQDMANLMRNLRDDAKSFQPTFNNSIKRSVIRKTSREKDAKDLVARFVRQTDGMLNNFRRTKKADTQLSLVQSSAAQINQLVYDLKLDPQTTARWEKVRDELRQVASAYGVPDQINRGAAAATPFGNN
jgi:hypothetical protein